LIPIGDRTDETLAPSLCSVTGFVVVVVAWDSTSTWFKARLDTPHEHITIYSLASPVVLRDTGTIHPFTAVAVNKHFSREPTHRYSLFSYTAGSTAQAVRTQ